VTARSDAGARLDQVHPRTRVPLTLEAPSTDLEVDAAVVAYPHGAAAPVVAELRARGVKVVDLSADFRLRDRGIYEDWYGAHGAPDLFGGAVYGLPELTRDDVRDAALVANPGCYPTAALLALAPLARAGLIGDVVIDAKSGVSGAGRGAYDYCTADENLTPYKVERHRHTPEIEQELQRLGARVTITFTPHLVTAARDVDEAEIAALYDDAYAREPWVELRLGPPGVLDVRETNYCRLSVHFDPRTGRVLVFSAIDNLWKGAASQAIQNLNLMFGLDESAGLR
jgi:N-acetyl-gamma-glutamyl-phosphate reductase